MITDFNGIIKSRTPVLVDFSAEWCGPCKMMKPVLEQLKGSMGDKIRIIKVDVDKNPELAAKYNIRSVPSLMIFQDGSLKWSGTGVVSANHLIHVINNSCTVFTDQAFL